MDLSRWPPTLDETIAAGLKVGKQGDGSTRHEGRITWKINANAAPFKFPMSGGDVVGARAPAAQPLGGLDRKPAASLGRVLVRSRLREHRRAVRSCDG